MKSLLNTCKWTIVDKFLRICPSIDIICSEFSKNFPGKETIKMGAYNMGHVFIDFDNLDDHLYVSSRKFIMIGTDMVMTLKNGLLDSSWRGNPPMPLFGLCYLPPIALL